MTTPPDHHTYSSHARAKLAEDEPRCETLRQENEALTVYLIKCRDTQLALLQAVKDMKQQHTDLRQRRVRIFSSCRAPHV